MGQVSPAARGLEPDILARRGLLLVVGATAVTGVLAGLSRAGVVAAWGPRYGAAHGPLFVLGVFGTLIALERAVALGRTWAFLAPVAGASGSVATLAGLAFGPWALALSAVALGAVNIAIVLRQPAAFTFIMLAGSMVLCVGSLTWAMGRPVPDVVLAWMSFFALTIAAERLELSRLAPTPRWASRAVVGISVIVALAAAAARSLEDPWSRLFGAALAALAAWQLSFDLARRTVRGVGLPRYTAAGVLGGAAWMLASGATLAFTTVPPGGASYDLVLHAVFVGYVLSMVFAHAPIILPAVARIEIPFTRALYAPLLLLHLSLLARVTGDLAGHPTLRRVGSIGNVLALATFVAVVVGVKVAKRR